MKISLYPNSCVWAQMLAAKCEKYEEDTISQHWVMAHFTCIYYVPMWPRPLTYFHQNWVTWLGARAQYMCLILSV